MFQDEPPPDAGSGLSAAPDRLDLRRQGETREATQHSGRRARREERRPGPSGGERLVVHAATAAAAGGRPARLRRRPRCRSRSWSRVEPAAPDRRSHARRSRRSFRRRSPAPRSASGCTAATAKNVRLFRIVSPGTRGQARAKRPAQLDAHLVRVRGVPGTRRTDNRQPRAAHSGGDFFMSTSIEPFARLERKRRAGEPRAFSTWRSSESTTAPRAQAPRRDRLARHARLAVSPPRDADRPLPARARRS